MEFREQNKYTVAWFKLAECVARKEKERAFGVYRLLSHSFENDALAAQLAGDLFLSFNDLKGAVQKYLFAADTYRATGQFLQSAAIYEHLVTLEPCNERFRSELVAIYKQMQMSSGRIYHHLKVLFEAALAKRAWDQARALLDELTVYAQPHERARVEQALASHLLQHSELAHDVIEKYAVAAVNSWIAADAVTEVEQFLQNLTSVDAAFAERISDYYLQAAK